LISRSILFDDENGKAIHEDFRAQLSLAPACHTVARLAGDGHPEKEAGANRKGHLPRHNTGRSMAEMQGTLSQPKMGGRWLCVIYVCAFAVCPQELRCEHRVCTILYRRFSGSQVKSMSMKPVERERMNWLCRQIQEEKDPHTFDTLVKELKHILDTKREQFYISERGSQRY
jgi:hypothetical protein